MKIGKKEADFLAEDDKKKEKPMIPTPKEIPKDALKQYAAPAKMTLEQWVQQLGFFAHNSTTLAKMLLEMQTFLVRLNDLMRDIEKRPTHQKNKSVKKVIDEIRILMEQCKVRILPRAPKLPANLPVPHQSSPLGNIVGNQFIHQPRPTILPPIDGISLKQRSVNKARANIKLKEIVDMLPEIEKQKQKENENVSEKRIEN